MFIYWSEPVFRATFTLTPSFLNTVIFFALQLSGSTGVTERHLQMSSVLQEAFDDVNSELQSVLQGDVQGCSSAPAGRLEDERTMSLLEKYSELLVQMTQNKLERL